MVNGYYQKISDCHLDKAWRRKKRRFLKNSSGLGVIGSRDRGEGKYA